MTGEHGRTTTTGSKGNRKRRGSVIESFFPELFEDGLLSLPRRLATTAHHQPQPARPRSAHCPPTARPLPAHCPPIPKIAAMASVRFCMDDTVGLRDDKTLVGVVDRSFGDVDTHEPRPQRDYDEDIERHSDISREQFTKFMKSGIPPRGTVLVSWQTVSRTELVPEAKLELLDRALYVGDVVKRSSKDPMSGTVIGTKATCSLFPVTEFPTSIQLQQPLPEGLSIRDVPVAELINIHEYVDGALVVYYDWIGRIEAVMDDVAVKLSNNSVVVVERDEELDPEDPLIERLSVGDRVRTKKGNLRRGRWKFGAFDPNVKPEGVVVETRTVAVDVNWLARRFGTSSDGSSYPGTGPPPEHLTTDDLESTHFHTYDANPSAASTLPQAADGTGRSFHVAEVVVGDRVRFKDLTGAAIKYNGTYTLPNGLPQGKVTRIARTESLGYDMNVYLVMQTHSRVTVQWQDLSVTEDPSPLLIPDPSIGDDDEVWPGEIVCTKEERKDKPADGSWTSAPAKVGIVQTVQSRDRIATVRWFHNANIGFVEEDLMPPAITGELGAEKEDVSLYDIRSTSGLTRRRGDFVLIHPSTIQEIAEQHSNLSGPNWFGEVVDLDLNGELVVRLGAAKPVVDIQIPYERVTLVYSSDMENQFDLIHSLEGDSVEDSEEDEESNFETSSFNEMWIEYEGMDGEPIGDNDEEEWSTEDDDDNDDESMPDLESPDGVDTSKTTPEAHSDGERRSLISDSAPLQESTSAPQLLAEDLPASVPSEATGDADAEALVSFLILDTPPPSNHPYLGSASAATSSTLMKRIMREHKILRSSLPPGIFVRTWESRLDLIRVLMIGPSDTPYEYAPFVIDFHLGSNYPAQPPEAFFHSWTHGNGPVNPNLYEDGKICLSLLGTWHADERNESWSPGKSTLLQVLVSIMGLVLVKEPYYNEAGYDVHREAPETKLSSALYTERAYFRARAFIVHSLSNNIEPFTAELKHLYLKRQGGAPTLLDKAISTAKEILERSEKSEDGERDGLRAISRGAAVMLKRQVEKLEELTARIA